MAGRKKTTATPIVEEVLPQEVIDSVASTQNTAAVAGAMNDERDLVNQLLGQAQMADSIAKFTATVAVSKMAYVKENKLYQAIAGMKDRDGRGLRGTWEEFCALLGSSAPKVNEDINNLKNFGEEALESMSRMGIGYREMRQYRRLPEDEKAALIEVAKAGDPDAFTELAETIIEKHVKEKEALTKRAEDAEANNEAQSEMLANARAERDEALQNLASAKRRSKRMAVEEAEQELRREAAEVAFQAEISLSRDLREVCSTVLQFAEEKGMDYRGYLAGMVRQMELKLMDLREEFGLPDDGDPEDFSWMGKEMLDSIESEQG